MSDFKKAFRQKQTMLLSEDSTSVNKRENIFQPCRRDTKRRNKNINHALPLTSFFSWHSSMSHKHHKWSFCSINSVDIYSNVHFFGAFDPEKHRFQLAQRDYKISKKLPVNLAKSQRKCRASNSKKLL